MSVLWVGGRLLPPDGPALAGDDHGVLVGDGVFETVLVDRRVPFALGRHLRRLARSAAGLELPVDLDAVRAGVREVLAAAGDVPAAAKLRITVTGGRAGYGSERAADAAPTVLVALTGRADWAPVADVVTVPWPRNERGVVAGLKTTSYVENVMALRHARRRGGSEAIFATTDGRLCEGTGANVFLATGGRLLTPSLGSGCLAGVTRELLLEWLPAAAEADLPLGALAEADEAFLASTTRAVQPIRAVDGRPLAACPGPLTRAAADTFARRAAADPDP